MLVAGVRYDSLATNPGCLSNDQQFYFGAIGAEISPLKEEVS